MNINGIQWDIAKRWWGKDIEGKIHEIDVMAESFDKQSLLVGEAKWEDITDIAQQEYILTKKINQLPFLKRYKNIIKAFWLKNPTNNDKKYNAFTPSDVMKILR